MAQLFSFKHLRVSFLKMTKSMDIELLYEGPKNYLSLDHIIELEQIFNWAANHLEIASITLHSSNDSLGLGFNPALFDRVDETLMRAILLRIQKLSYAIFFLPQTTIVNIGNGSQGVMSELVIPFDIKIARDNADIRFNHLFKGRTPACGGIGFLNQVVSNSFVRKWILLGDRISQADLIQSGLIHKFADDIENELLEEINKQSPTARIQAKRTLLETILPELDRAMDYEQRFATASLVAGDWKNSTSYKNPLELSKELKHAKNHNDEPEFDNVINLAEMRSR